MAAALTAKSRAEVKSLKDKEIVKANWHLKGDLTKSNKEQWYLKDKDKKITLTAVKNSNPYFLSRLTFWQWLESEKDFPVIPLLRGDNSQISLEASDYSYFAVKEAKARTLDFGDEKTIKKIVKTLGKLHKIAGVFDWQEYSLPQKKCQRYIPRMEKLITKAEACFGKSKKLKSHWSSLLMRSERSLVLLCDGTLETLHERLMRDGEFAYGNICSQGFSLVNDQIQLTDLSRFAEDLGIFDLWQVFRRYLQYTKGNEIEIFEALASYEEERTLTNTEKKALMGLLLFPYDTFKSVIKDDKKEEVVKILALEEKRSAFYEEIYKRGRAAENENSD